MTDIATMIKQARVNERYAEAETMEGLVESMRLAKFQRDVALGWCNTLKLACQAALDDGFLAGDVLYQVSAAVETASKPLPNKLPETVA